MATTKKGIFYQYDYNSAADIPQDMKKMAESIDLLLDEIDQEQKNQKKDIEKNETNILDIQNKQNEQNKNIENLIEENERLKEDLNNSTITSSSSGENITIEGSAEARFKKLVVKGNSWQETREGYNLINITAENQTFCGVTLTNNKDGTVTLNGECSETTSAFSLLISNQSWKAEDFPYDKPIIVSCKGLIEGMEWGYGEADEKGSWIRNIVNIKGTQNISKLTATKGENAVYIRSNIRIEKGLVLNNLKLYPMLYEGTEEKPFQQYGAMPSLEFESPIRNCGDNVNSFDLKSWFENCATVSCTKILLENGIRMQFKGPDPWLGSVITEQGAAPQESSKKAAIEVFEDTDYILSISATPKCFISFHDKDYISINYKQIPSSDKETSYSFKTPKNCKYILLRLGKNDPNYTTDTTFDFTNIKLERGTKATPYSPYGCGNVNVNIKDNAEQQQKKSFPTKEGQVFHKGDYLADNGTHQTRKTIELDGTINKFISVHPSIYTDTHHFFLMEISDKYNKGANGSTEYCLCSHLKISNQTPSNAIKETCLWWEGSSKVIYCSLPFENSYSIANNWLKELKEAGTPVKLEYKLENEIIEPYSPEQQEAWEQIKNAKTYKGTTYIFSDDEISPEFEEEHLVDLEAYINNKLGVKANNEPQQEIPNQPSMEQPQLEETKIIGGEE